MSATQQTMREARARRRALDQAEQAELAALARRGALVVSILAAALTPWVALWALLWRWLA